MQYDSSDEKDMPILTVEPPPSQVVTMEDMLLKQQAMAKHFLVQQASQNDPECESSHISRVPMPDHLDKVNPPNPHLVCSVLWVS